MVLEAFGGQSRGLWGGWRSHGGIREGPGDGLGTPRRWGGPEGALEGVGEVLGVFRGALEVFGWVSRGCLGGALRRFGGGPLGVFGGTFLGSPGSGGASGFPPSLRRQLSANQGAAAARPAS